jgi:hypothetical protein
VQAVLTPDAPEAQKAQTELSTQQVTLMSTAVTAAPNQLLRFAATNESPLPVVIRKGAVLGVLEQPDELVEIDTASEERLTASLTRIALRSVKVAQMQPSEQDAAAPPQHGSGDSAARAAHRRQIAEEHNVGLQFCTDDELREVLMHDGEVIPALRGKDEHGIDLVERVMEMLRRRRKAFAQDPKNPRVTPAFDVVIDTGDAEPVADKARRWAEREAKFIMDHIAEVRKRGQIQPSHGPWASNPVLAVQNGKVRFCVDYRRVNKVTRRDSHGLGNMDDLMQKVASSSYFSALDFAQGFHQIPMDKDSACKTAFRAPDGSLWEYKVAPFGLVCLPSIFTRHMHTMLGSALNSHALVYVDDVMVHSKTLEDHIAHLDDVLARVEAAGMCVSRHKCQLFHPLLCIRMPAKRQSRGC